MKKIFNLIMIVAVSAIIFQSCKSKPTDKDVQAVVESFVKAIANDDYNKAKELATDGSDKMLEMQSKFSTMINDTVAAEMEAAKELERNATLTFGATTFNDNGTEAKVSFTSSAGGGEESFHLKKVEDKWLVDMEADMPASE